MRFTLFTSEGNGKKLNEEIKVRNELKKKKKKQNPHKNKTILSNIESIKT